MYVLGDTPWPRRAALPEIVGKSTLLGVLASEVLPYAGTCALLGTDVLDERTRRHRSWVPQHLGLVPALSLAEHLDLTIHDPAVRAEADRFVERLGIASWLDKPCAQLSTGNARKSWLALCLARPRPVLLLNEPDDRLDAQSTSALAEILDERVSAGASIVFVSHREPLIAVDVTIAVPPQAG